MTGDPVEAILERIRRAGLLLGNDAAKRTGDWAHTVESEGLAIAFLADQALEARRYESLAEPDEPAEDVIAAFEAAEKGRTARPDGCTCLPEPWATTDAFGGWCRDCPVHGHLHWARTPSTMRRRVDFDITPEGGS